MEHDVLVRVLMRDRGRLLAYIRAIVVDVHLAEDVLQEVSADAVRKADEIRDDRHLIRWLRQAARFRGIDAVRGQSRAPLRLDDTALDRLDAVWDEDASPLADHLEALAACVEQLSPYGRRLIGLRYGEGKSGAALAGATGREVNTVYVALSRVHARLRDCVRGRLRASHA